MNYGFLKMFQSTFLPIRYLILKVVKTPKIIKITATGGIHKGEVTIHQDQLTTPVSLKIKKIRKISNDPPPFSSLNFFIGTNIQKIFYFKTFFNFCSLISALSEGMCLCHF